MKNFLKKFFTRQNINMFIDFCLFLFLIFIGVLALIFLYETR